MKSIYTHKINRESEALQVLADLHGNGDRNSDLVALEYEEIKCQVYFERTEGAKSYKDLFKPGIFRRVGLGCSLQMWSQLTGMNVMMSVANLPNSAGEYTHLYRQVLHHLRFPRCRSHWHSWQSHSGLCPVCVESCTNDSCHHENRLVGASAHASHRYSPHGLLALSRRRSPRALWRMGYYRWPPCLGHHRLPTCH